MVRFVAIRENLIERATVFSISDYFAIMDRLYQFELDLLAALGNDSGRSRIGDQTHSATGLWLKAPASSRPENRLPGCSVLWAQSFPAN